MHKHLVEVIVPSAPVWALRAAVGLWLVSVIWKLSRLGIACWQLHRVKRSCAPLSDADLARLPLWHAVSQRGRGATLAVSEQVGVACPALQCTVLSGGRRLAALEVRHLPAQVADHRTVERAGADHDPQRDAEEHGDDGYQVIAKRDHENRPLSQEYRWFQPVVRRCR